MAKMDLKAWRGSPKYWHKLASIYSSKLKADPDSYLHIPLADALINLGKINEAVLALEDGLKAFPNSRTAKIMLAKLLYKKGGIDKAKQLLAEIVFQWPDAIGAVSLLCEIYEKEEDLESAKIISNKLADYFPDLSYVKNLAWRYNGEQIEEDSSKELDEGSRVKIVAKLETMLIRINRLKDESLSPH